MVPGPHIVSTSIWPDTSAEPTSAGLISTVASLVEPISEPIISISSAPSGTSILNTLYSVVVSVSSKTTLSPSTKIRNSASTPSDTESIKLLSRVTFREPEEGASTYMISDL